MLSGFTIVRNAVTLDYPIIPAIQSILAICDEVVVNVGTSADGTRDLVAAIADPRVRILDTAWDLARGSAMLADETDRAMRACRGRWGVYIQADEVLHEAGAATLRDLVREWDGDQRVEGLLVDYLHFYSDFDTVATNRHWYRREVRCVRLGRDIHSFQDAQGFRVGAERRRVRARVTGARMFHYGWARAGHLLRQKLAASREIFAGVHADAEWRRRGRLEWTPLLRPFRGDHPRAAREWIAARRDREAGTLGPRRFDLDTARCYVSHWIERLTGRRVFEYCNYVVV